MNSRSAQPFLKRFQEPTRLHEQLAVSDLLQRFPGVQIGGDECLPAGHSVSVGEGEDGLHLGGHALLPPVDGGHGDLLADLLGDLAAGGVVRDALDVLPPRHAISVSAHALGRRVHAPRGGPDLRKLLGFLSGNLFQSERLRSILHVDAHQSTQGAPSMANYSVEELLTEEQRKDFELTLTTSDVYAIAVFVMDNYPAVFDAAAASVNRMRLDEAAFGRRHGRAA